MVVVLRFGSTTTTAPFGAEARVEVSSETDSSPGRTREEEEEEEEEEEVEIWSSLWSLILTGVRVTSEERKRKMEA